ncbi:MAG: DUF2510 domain-containing protein [Arachnia sp.]
MPASLPRICYEWVTAHPSDRRFASPDGFVAASPTSHKLVVMAQPGWYSDPSAPNGRRYWDGRRWLDPDQPARAGKGRWLWLAVALVAATALVVALIVLPRGQNSWGAVPEDTRSARPTGTQWNELLPSETPPPDDTDDGFGEPIDCPVAEDWGVSEIVNGRLHGGGLSIEPPTGSKWTETIAYIDWMHDSNSMTRPIATGWISNVNVGYIKVSEGFSNDLPTAAEQFITCMASSGMFASFTHRDVLNDSAYTVSGRRGWRLTSNVFVSNQRYQGIEGDVVDIVLVPTDDPDKIAAYVSCATIGHEENQGEVRHSLESLRYDG